MKRLEALDSDDLALAVLAASTPAAVRAIVARRPEVVAVRRALESSELSARDVQRFVSSMLMDLQRGRRFPHEPALSALSVALEQLPSASARSLLADLAALRIHEMPMSPRVAAACLRARKVAENTYAAATFVPPSREGVELRQFEPTRSSVGSQIETLRLDRPEAA